MNQRLKQQFAQYAARYSALAPRERALLPGAICFAILMLGHLLVIEPAFKERRLLQQRLTQEGNDLAVAQAQLQVLRAKVNNPDAEARAQLEALRVQARHVDDQFKQLQSSLVPPQDMSQWLSGLLQAQRGLQLVGLRTLPVTSVSGHRGRLYAAGLPRKVFDTDLLRDVFGVDGSFQWTDRGASVRVLGPADALRHL